MGILTPLIAGIRGKTKNSDYKSNSSVYHVIYLAVGTSISVNEVLNRNIPLCFSEL